MNKKPNPGSDEARAQGCRCPVLDNCHGKAAPYPPDGWFINENCPLHGNRATLPGSLGER